MDLTLRDGIHLQEAIQTAKEIDQKSKLCGFNQTALDQMAKHGYSNAQFELNAQEGLDLVEDFYSDENQETNMEQNQAEMITRAKTKSKPNRDATFVQDIQKGLQGSVRAVN